MMSDYLSTYLVIVHALAHLPLALDILGDVVGVVVEELRHGRQEHSPEDDAQAAEDEGPGPDVATQTTSPETYHRES